MRVKFALTLALVVAAGLLVAAQMGQQDKSKRPSPPGKSEVTLKGKKITVDYSRPKVRDPKSGETRKIFGGVVPYGQRWRTGANEATSFVTEADLTVGGTNVPAGKYTLYTIPEQDKWTLIINKQTGQWGTDYDQAQDLARIPMTTEKTEKPVEQFTISLDKKGADAATLKLEWENTRASVDLQAK